MGYMKFRIIRKLKGLFYVLRLHVFIPSRLFIFLGHMGNLSRWISKNNKQAGFSDFYQSKHDYNNRYKLYEFLLQKEQLNQPLDYLEFGVAGGHSFRWWAEHITDPGAQFYGFDTFTGLPEDWGPFKKGDMSNHNAPPALNDQRVKFYQGIFQTTLLPFLKNYQPNSRRVIHLDADLYSSTLYVLFHLTPFIRKGDILLFDEFSVPMHEFKALTEWAAANYIEYEVLAGVNNYFCAALKVI